MCSKFFIVDAYPSLNRERTNLYVRFFLYWTESLSKQFCNNALISVTGFLRVSTNLARIGSSSRNFSRHAGYVSVSIRMHQNARYIRGVFKREAVAAKNQLR